MAITAKGNAGEWVVTEQWPRRKEEHTFLIYTETLNPAKYPKIQILGEIGQFSIFLLGLSVHGEGFTIMLYHPRR